MSPTSPAPDYNFIFNPQQPKGKTPLGFLSGTSRNKKLAIVAGGAIIFMIIIVIVAAIFSGGSTNSTQLISLAQQQNELIRVATEASQKGVDQGVKNMAVNTQLVLSTDQQDILSFLSQHHIKVSSKQLSLTQSSTTDQQLSQAAASSNFDQVYMQITESALQTYEQDIVQSYKSANGTTEMQMLSNEYSNAKLLLAQAKSAAQNLQG